MAMRRTTSMLMRPNIEASSAIIIGIIFSVVPMSWKWQIFWLLIVAGLIVELAFRSPLMANRGWATKILISVISLVILVAISWRSVADEYRKATNPLGPRLWIEGFDVNRPKSNRPFSMNIHFKNNGSLPARELRHSDALLIRENPLTYAEIEDVISKIYKNITPLVPPQTNEIQPGQSNGYYSIEGNNLSGTPLNENTWNDMVKGKKFIYVMTLLEYRHESLAKGKWWGTESCIYFYKEAIHLCDQHNRIIMSD